MLGVGSVGDGRSVLFQIMKFCLSMELLASFIQFNMRLVNADGSGSDQESSESVSQASCKKNMNKTIVKISMLQNIKNASCGEVVE